MCRLFGCSGCGDDSNYIVVIFCIENVFFPFFFERGVVPFLSACLHTTRVYCLRIHIKLIKFALLISIFFLCYIDSGVSLLKSGKNTQLAYITTQSTELRLPRLIRYNIWIIFVNGVLYFVWCLRSERFRTNNYKPRSTTTTVENACTIAINRVCTDRCTNWTLWSVNGVQPNGK